MLPATYLEWWLKYSQDSSVIYPFHFQHVKDLKTGIKQNTQKESQNFLHLSTLKGYEYTSKGGNC